MKPAVFAQLYNMSYTLCVCFFYGREPYTFYQFIATFFIFVTFLYFIASLWLT